MTKISIDFKKCFVQNLLNRPFHHSVSLGLLSFVGAA